MPVHSATSACHPATFQASRATTQGDATKLVARAAESTGALRGTARCGAVAANGVTLKGAGGGISITRPWYMRSLTVRGHKWRHGGDMRGDMHGRLAATCKAPLAGSGQAPDPLNWAPAVTRGTRTEERRGAARRTPAPARCGALIRRRRRVRRGCEGATSPSAPARHAGSLLAAHWR